jgi:hypothetical protein
MLPRQQTVALPKPYIIIPRKVLEAELDESAFPQESPGIVHEDDKLVARLLCEDWLAKALIPDAISQREGLGWHGQFAQFLSIDDVGGHRLFYGIELLIIPVHAFDEVQPLDLSGFAIHELESHRIYPYLNPNDQLSKLNKMLCGLKRRRLGRI